MMKKSQVYLCSFLLIAGALFLLQGLGVFGADKATFHGVIMNPFQSILVGALLLLSGASVLICAVREK